MADSRAHQVPALRRPEAEAPARQPDRRRMSGFVCASFRSVSGQPWRSRRDGGDDLGIDLVDQLLLARGVDPADLARHRAPTLRDFLPDPSLFADMDKARRAARRCGRGGRDDRHLRRL